MNNEDAIKAIDAALFALELAANIQTMIARYQLIKADAAMNGGNISADTLREVLDGAKAAIDGMG